MIGVYVRFRNMGQWSKPYTYKTELDLEYGDLILVPTGDFFSVAKVVKVTDKLNLEIGYRKVIQKLGMKSLR